MERRRGFSSIFKSKQERNNSSGRIRLFLKSFKRNPRHQKNELFNSIQTSQSSTPIDKGFDLTIVEVETTDNALSFNYTDAIGSTLSVDESNDEAVVDVDDDENDEDELERLTMRLGGFDSYVLIGLWVSTSCVGDLLTSEFRNREGALPPSMRCGIIMCGSFICLLGLYSTVVFATSILYGKTAVGLGKDKEYLIFMRNTGIQRGRAFKLLVRSIFAFTVIVCLIAINHLPRLECLTIGVIALILGYLLYIGTKDVRAILSAAAPIFAPTKTSNKNNKNSRKTTHSPRSCSSAAYRRKTNKLGRQRTTRKKNYRSS